MKRGQTYVCWGLTAFAVICGVLVFYDIFFQESVLIVYFKKLVGILAPVSYGFVLAYVLTPVVNWLEQRVFQGRRRRGVRAASIFITWILVGLFFYILLSILLPQLYQSILSLINNAEGYYKTIVNWAERFLADQPVAEQWINGIVEQYYSDTTDMLAWVRQTLLPQASSAITVVTGSLLEFFNFIKNFLVGIIVSVYLLATKENFAATGCKLMYSFFSEKRAEQIIRGIKEVNRIFSGFFRGKILDSLIIGILCFIGASILNFPYAPLISVVVGVTNVIPFFGPFLGAIPCAFIILLDSPIKCLYFIIFIIVLQQFDGNILGPKILGDSTGISSFWVIVAILVGGGLWGVVGMFVGVPLCACIFTGIRRFTEWRLEAKGLPKHSYSYRTHRPVWDREKPDQADPEKREEQ